MRQAIELTKLAPYLSNDQKDQFFGRALNASLTIENVSMQAQALTALATQFTGEERLVIQRKVLIAAQQVEKQYLGQDSYLVEGIAPQLTDALLVEVLTAVLEFEHSESRTYALISLMPQLTKPMLLEAFEATQKFADPPNGWGRHQARIALMQCAPDELLPLCLQKIQALPERSRYDMLAIVAPRLNGKLLQLALNMTDGINDEILRARAIMLFLPFMSNQALLLKSIRLVLLHELRTLLVQNRQNVLKFCALEDLFTPPILLPETLTTIARYIMEICHEWD